MPKYFLHEYYNRRKKFDRLLEKQRQQMNAPITVRDLVIYSTSAEACFGEYYVNEPPYPEYDSVKRLIDHIRLLALLGNRYHEQHYCEKGPDGYQLQEKHFNTITRLSSPEFFFYRKTPLSSNEFMEAS